MAEMLTGAYKGLYEAAKERLGEEETRRKAAALRRTRAAGVMTSGVGQLPYEPIEREAMREETELGARLQAAQRGEVVEEERAKTAFEREKELMGLRFSLAEAARKRLEEEEKKAAKKGFLGRAIGGGLGALGGYFLGQPMAGAQIGSQIGGEF